MADTSVFNANQVYRGAFNIANSVVTFAGQAADHLVQNIQYNFTQQISMIYELGSPNVYFNGGRASGNAALNRILVALTKDKLFESFNDVCSPNDIHITQASGCTTKPSGTGGTVSPTNTVNPFINTRSELVLKSAVLSNIGGSQDNQSAVFTEQMSFLFLNMTRSVGAGTGQTTTPAATTPTTVVA